jgi:hypothetical protein
MIDQSTYMFINELNFIMNSLFLSKVVRYTLTDLLDGIIVKDEKSAPPTLVATPSSKSVASLPEDKRKNQRSFTKSRSGSIRNANRSPVITGSLSRYQEISDPELAKAKDKLFDTLTNFYANETPEERARRLRQEVIGEIIATEVIYVKNLTSIKRVCFIFHSIR